MKTILITNDDGIYGPGLRPLINELKKIGRVIVVVPDQERSGTSHSITLHKPIRIHKVDSGIYVINGTPADCVRFGTLSIAKRKVDLVVSGINAGPNLGEDVIYSGTVAGAREGSLLNIPSFAVSIAKLGYGNFPLTAKVSKAFSNILLSQKLPGQIYFNINSPNKVKGYKITSLCKRVYDEEIECRTDPRGHKYYWLAGKSISGISQQGTDLNAVENNIVSITPLQLNPTPTHLFGLFNQWIKDLN